MTLPVIISLIQLAYCLILALLLILRFELETKKQLRQMKGDL